MDTEYEYGENSVSVMPQSSHASIDELVAMANEIWKKIQSKKINLEDEKASNELLSAMHSEYSEFGHSFPLVLRWMVQTNTFYTTVFKKYLAKHAAAKLSTKEDYLKLQAEYLVLIYRHENKHADESHIRKYRSDIISALTEEDNTFTEVKKELEETLANDAKLAAEEKRIALYELLKRRKD